MQGAEDTHVGQAMFIMTEVIALLQEGSQPIRVANATVLPTPPAGIPTEVTEVTDLTMEAQDVLEAMLEVMEDTGLGKALQKVERLCALLDPRRKTLGADQLVNGSVALRMRAEQDLQQVVDSFEDAQAQASNPVPAPVVDPAEPATKKKKYSIGWRNGASNVCKRNPVVVVVAAVGTSFSPVTGRRVLIGREVLVYLAEARHPDVDSFNLLGFWNRQGTDSLCPTTGKVISPAEIPFLACIARLYLGIEATSCQSERNFSALAHLIGDLRSNMLAYKVERMMFIRLNRHLVDEVRALDAAVEQARARVPRSAQKSAAAQAERSNMSIDLSL